MSSTRIFQFLLLFLLSHNKLLGQYLTGKIIDSNTKEGIAFVSIQNGKTGTSSDINGFFKIKILNDTNILKFSCLGYKNISKTVTKLGNVTIVLEANIQTLNEVVVRPEQNPANEIIKKAINNKNRNNPKNYSSYSYYSYNKIYARLNEEATILKKDSVLKKRLETNELLVSESVILHKYRKSNISKEKVIATKTSGVKSPLLASLLTDFQPFSFYEDFFFTTITDKYYLNPLADSKFEKYDFFMLDTLVQESDSTFVIAFSPKKKSNFNGLSGYLHINNHLYGIKKVVVESNEKKSVLYFKIQQEYDVIENSWFPIQNNTKILINDTTNLMYGTLYIHKSTFTDIKINKPVPLSDFDSVNREVLNPSESQKDSLLSMYRSDSLTLKESNTYEYYKKNKKANQANFLYDVLESVFAGKIALSKVKLPLEKLINFNNFEGFRIGFGFETIFKIVNFNSYFGYGLKDNRAKYGLGVAFNLDKKQKKSIEAFFSRDLEEPAKSRFDKIYKLPYNLRNYLVNRMDSVGKFGLIFKNNLSSKLSYNLSILYERRKPLYDYQFKDYNLRSELTNAEIALQFNYSNAKKMDTGKNILTFHVEKPLFYARIEKSITLLGSMLNYTKINIGYENQILFKGSGQLLYQVDAGYINGNLPYSYQYNGQGSNRQRGIRYIKNTFQTMGLYEYISDRYFSVLLNHNFGKPLFKTNSNIFSPELSLYHGLLIGNLSNLNEHKGIDISIPSKGFLEGGILINKLINFKYIKTIYINLGVGVFSRYGPYAFDSTKDNIVGRLLLNATF